ncbi:MAG: histidine ammonia-lyase [Cyclobacteriaceae bacterium]|nr:histidine ammonia-lyase [Cyclobacteriaceae bacterium]
MNKKYTISAEPLSLEQVGQLLASDFSIELSDDSRSRVIKCRDYLDKKVKESSNSVYGINTGFGSLYSKNIDGSELGKLQQNLVMSHACGTGDEVPQEIVHLMLFLKVQSLAYGYSGVQLETIQHLIALYNNKALPVVYQMGSLGASGDLAPLAHLTLPLIGMGEVYHEDKKISGDATLKKLGLNPIAFKAKEGLALLNGTQFMSAYGVWSVLHAQRLLKLANYIGALSLDSFDGRIEPFDPQVHAIRHHKGQSSVAAEIKKLLEGSALITQSKKHVQDPYSFRCIPQVHGATADVIDFVSQTFVTEINSVTDNPNVFPDEDKIVSAGNFHGQPLALAMDFLAIGLAELGSISERRTYQLISGARDLPNYLVANPGINSGLMIPQYTAASLVSQNKQLCTPASADSIVSSNGQEDHVSMGANAATKLYKVVNNLYSILAIELMTAAQALEFRRPLKTSPVLEEFVNTFRSRVPFIETDRLLHDDIVKAEKFLKEFKI